MRIAVASFGQETNSFSPNKTDINTFMMYGLHKHENVFKKKGRTSVIAGFLDRARIECDEKEIVPIFKAWAGASGIIKKETFDYFKRELEISLIKIRDIDAFFFDLHGAAQSENFPDTEGELLELSRNILGNKTVIFIALDHHANVTEKMIVNIDGLVAHNEQPHNTFNTGYRAAELLLTILEEK